MEMPIAKQDLTFQVSTMSVEVERFQKLTGESSCVGFAKVKFKTDAGSISIDNFRLVKGGKDGLFVAPPAHKRGEKWYDDVTVTDDLQKYMNAAIKMAYKEVGGDAD
jgi:DNA-binding cell septation regulator SpoVG